MNSGHSVSENRSNCAAGEDHALDGDRSNPVFPENSGDHTPCDDQSRSVASGRALRKTTPSPRMPAQEFDGPLSSDTHSGNAVDSGGHGERDAHPVAAPATPSSAGQRDVDIQLSHASARDDQRCVDAQLPHVIAEIREQHRQRVDLHRAEKSLTLQIKAICRRLCDGDKKEADVLYKAMLGKGEHSLATTALEINVPFIEARSVIEGSRKLKEKRLDTLAKQLPIADWVAEIRGIAMGSLAAVIGEAGNLSDYATVSRLWKRMGLAVIDGKRQRKVSGDAAIEQGYAPQRRAVVWNIGDCIIKAQSERVDKDTGEVLREAGQYRLIYDARKSYEHERDPEMSKGHAHNRAKRFMEKRFLRDLWREWRAKGQVKPDAYMPASRGDQLISGNHAPPVAPVEFNEAAD